MTLKHDFWELLLGFESYSWDEETIKLNYGDFSNALFDLKACKECDGTICRTSLNHRCSDMFSHIKLKQPCTDACFPQHIRGYTALSKKGCAQYKKPSFVVVRCYKHVERQDKIAEAMMSGRGDLFGYPHAG